MRVLITGASGFVGRELLASLLGMPGLSVRAAIRDARVKLPRETEVHEVGDLESAPDWTPALRSCDAIVHLAARAHLLRGTTSDAAAVMYRRVNTDGTLALARQAVLAGVRRFVFLSSIKVNGEQTRAGQPFSAQDDAHPADPYAISKWEAELGLREIAGRSALEVVIVRAPLVYGAGVKANFLRLLQWIDRGWPLPVAAVRNRRSLVSVWNLCDLLGNVLANAHARGGTWMVSDGEDLSTPELITRLARAMNRSARLLPVPVALLRAAGVLAGRQQEVLRLCSSLQVDARPTHDELGWSAPVGVDEGLRRTVAWYLAESRP